jgi:hypothetical protein
VNFFAILRDSIIIELLLSAIPAQIFRTITEKEGGEEKKREIEEESDQRVRRESQHQN